MITVNNANAPAQSLKKICQVSVPVVLRPHLHYLPLCRKVHLSDRKIASKKRRTKCALARFPATWFCNVVVPIGKNVMPNPLVYTCTHANFVTASLDSFKK